jgi:hypothetical protein
VVRPSPWEGAEQWSVGEQAAEKAFARMEVADRRDVEQVKASENDAAECHRPWCVLDVMYQLENQLDLVETDLAFCSLLPASYTLYTRQQ